MKKIAKYCDECQESYADRFGFCPVCGTPLKALPNAPEAETPKIEAEKAATANAVLATETPQPAPTPAIPQEIAVSEPEKTVPEYLADEKIETAGTDEKAVSATAATTGAAAFTADEATTPERISSTIENAPVNVAPKVNRGEFNLTIIENRNILTSLSEEVRSIAKESQLSYPEFKKNPAAFTGRAITGFGAAIGHKLSDPNTAKGVITSLVVLLSVVSALAIVSATDWCAVRGYVKPYFGGIATCEQLVQIKDEELQLQEIIDLKDKPQPTPKPGDAGNAKGKGGGQNKEQEKPKGGGGGGREEDTPASGGKPPIASLDDQIMKPRPNPDRVPNPSLPTPATIKADPTLFPPDKRNLPIGVTGNKITNSSGPGRDGGIGTGTNGGLGSGEDGGVGPGKGGNTGGGKNKPGGGGPGGGGEGGDPPPPPTPRPTPRPTPDIPVGPTIAVNVLSKPRPGYTEEARKNQVQGTVRLKVTFGANGQITNVTPIAGLGYGLTEKAIEAARQIRFEPAKKGGVPYTVAKEVTYTFNLL